MSTHERMTFGTLENFASYHALEPCDEGQIGLLKFLKMVLDPSTPPLVHKDKCIMYDAKLTRTNESCYIDQLCTERRTYEQMDYERWGAGVETQKNVRERLGYGVEYHLMKPTPHG